MVVASIRTTAAKCEEYVKWTVPISAIGPVLGTVGLVAKRIWGISLEGMPRLNLFKNIVVIGGSIVCAIALTILGITKFLNKSHASAIKDDGPSFEKPQVDENEIPSSSLKEVEERPLSEFNLPNDAEISFFEKDFTSEERDAYKSNIIFFSELNKSNIDSVQVTLIDDKGKKHFAEVEIEKKSSELLLIKRALDAVSFQGNIGDITLIMP